jgi:hypothetical protein
MERQEENKNRSKRIHEVKGKNADTENKKQRR